MVSLQERLQRARLSYRAVGEPVSTENASYGRTGEGERRTRAIYFFESESAHTGESFCA